MKIEKTNKPLPVAPSGGGQARASNAKPAPTVNHSTATQSTATNNNTSVHLGTKSTQLHDMESSMANAPLVNASKIAEIKQAISEGRFQVNSGVVADRLIETVKNLIRSHKT